MLNLFEILQNAQGGQAIGNLAQQYGLSQQQTQAALDALLPAFSMGLKRQAGDPALASNLLASFAAQNLAAAQSLAGLGAGANIFGQPPAPQQGPDILATLFGSKEVSQAVAAQAAALSGIGANILQAMMPTLAAMLMSGLAQAAAAQPQLQEIIAGMMSGAGFPTAATPQPPRPQGQPSPNGGGLFGALLGPLLQQGAQQSAPPPPRSAEPPETALSQMFETGLKMQQAQIDAFQSIFDAYVGKK
jgi:hypothetical protein